MFFAIKIVGKNVKIYRHTVRHTVKKQTRKQSDEDRHAVWQCLEYISSHGENNYVSKLYRRDGAYTAQGNMLLLFFMITSVYSDQYYYTMHLFILY